MKKCCVCSELKPSDSFSPDKGKKDGLASLCKACRNERYSTRYSRTYRSKRLQSLYGITVEQYDKLFDLQDGKCAICKSSDTGRGDEWFCVDHDHSTGKVRGLLCNNCNRGLGLFKDSELILKSAKNYVTTHRTDWTC